MIDNDFETLINKQLITYEKETKKNKVEDLKSDKQANITDLIDMISKISKKIFKNIDFEFVPDEGKRIEIDPKVKINKAYISYSVVSRAPVNIKPKHREEFTENNELKRHGIIHGQIFETILQFDIIACDYKTANMVMNKFEELLFYYVGYFKRNGIKELLFVKQFTDNNLDIYRDSLSVRSLQYKCTTEKLSLIYDSLFKEITKYGTIENNK